MFTPLDADTVLVTWHPPGPDLERAAVGRDGVPRRWFSPELPSAWLAPWDGKGPEPQWTAARVYPDDIMLTDEAGGHSRIVPLDRARLGLGDPAALDIMGAAPVPGRHEVIVGVAGSSDAAIYDYDTDQSEIVAFEGAGGVEPVAVVDGVVWLTNYNTLCRLDPPRSVRCSKVLQGPFRMAGYATPTPTGYIGRPAFVARRNGWLVPRPHTGDIVLVDAASLQPVSRIPLGGRPFALHLFEDGAMVIIDDSLDRFQTARLKDLRSF